MRGFFRSIAATFGFCTILPIGNDVDFDYYAKRYYLMPLVGYLTGCIAAGVAILLGSSAFAAAASIAVILILYGFNHLDGLLDFGDGLMAHGSREKRIKALTDQNVGAGGVGLAMVVILMTYSGLFSVSAMPATLIAAEVCAKFSQVVMIAYGKPLREGIHSYVRSFGKKSFIISAFLLCIPLILLPFSLKEFTAMAAALILSMVSVYFAASHLFGGVNGDVDGAAGEITRMAVIVALALAA
ncbi:MAG: adenosylcobinamide-GDP ribazoletransferase [Methanomicrobiaceae archaeon]|nr:adenosylcobinamide-GDP ribazoletransferase [Methanomicrobiaceae archaeon]